LTEQRQERPLGGSIKWVKIEKNEIKYRVYAIFHDITPYPSLYVLVRLLRLEAGHPGQKTFYSPSPGLGPLETRLDQPLYQ
jgi:hypothetical protein